MTPGRYTELFFLDEVTALAAGHRPCGECRRADYRRFKAAWVAGNARLGLAASAPIAALDFVLHGDRLTADGSQRTFEADLGELPDGAFVNGPDPAVPHLVWRGALWPWSMTGYGSPVGAEQRVATVLTPLSTVGALRAGYSPMVHASAVR